MGAYIALHHGNEAVFLCSVLLIAIDLAYIAVILPESLGGGEEEEDQGEQQLGGYEVGGRERGRSILIKKRRPPNYGDEFTAFQVQRRIESDIGIALFV